MATTSFHPGVVRRRGFGAGREYMLGVEEELMLLDPETLALAPAIEPIIAYEHGRGPAKRELRQCQAEVTTTPCATAEEVLEQLRSLREALGRDAASRGVVVAAAGTHPFSVPETQPITAEDRYRELEAALRYPVRQTVCFGMHVHVSVGGGDKALQLIEALLGDLPLLLAVSASSPFWRGEETGLASTRTIVGQAMPRTGLPPAFASFGEFEALLGRLREAGAIEDITHVWWDVRPQVRLGTIEVRVMDVQADVEDAAAIAALVQALVRHYGKRYDRGEAFPQANRFVVGENRWLSVRHGLGAPLISAGGTASARALIEERLFAVEEDAAAIGAEWALRRIANLLERGTSADRQLRLYREGHTFPEILEMLVHETSPR